MDWNICRTCLSKENLQPIFNKPKYNSRYSATIQLATGLEVQLEDGLPQKMCSKCIDTVNSALDFRKLCEKIEIKLIKMGFVKNKNPKERTKMLRSFKLEPPKKLKKDEMPCDQSLNISEEFEDTTYVDNNSDENEDVKVEMELKMHCILCREPLSGLDAMDVCKNCAEFDHTDLKADIKTDFIKQEYALNKNIDTNDSKKKVRKGWKEKNVKKETVFKCKVCEEEFSSKIKLKEHSKIHKDKKYFCESCGKKSHNRQTYLQHLRGQHGLERVDKCAYCDYRAVNKAQLQVHERRHTGEKPFECAHCGSGFHRRANLLQHLAVHLADKTVQCDECPSKFKSVRFLRAHKNKSHKQRVYTHVCYVCSNKFATRFNTRLHIVRVHGIPKDQQDAIEKVRI